MSAGGWRWLLRAVTAALFVTAALDARADCQAPDLCSSGGPVAAFQHVYLVYWGWQTYGDPSNDRWVATGLLGNADDPTFGLGGTKWINTEVQYSAPSDYQFGAGSWAPINFTGTLAGSYDDARPVPNPITPAAVGNEVSYLVSNNLISPSKDWLILVMLPNGFAAPTAGDCAAHYVWNNNLVGWVAYPASNPGCPADPSQAIAHELVETTTDPANAGWRQPGTQQEIGDLCQGYPFEVQVQAQSSWLVPSLYRAQQFWSNEAQACVYARSTEAFVFGIGTDHKLWAELVESDATSALFGWYSWGSSNGGADNFVYGPGATSWGPNRLDVFAVAQGTGLLSHAWSDDGGNTAQWETLPALPSGFIARAPDAVSWGAGNVQVFVKGEVFYSKWSWSTTIWSNTYEWGQGWLGWQNVGSTLGVMPSSKISVASPMASGVGGTTPRSVYGAFKDTSSLLHLVVVHNGVMTNAAAVTPTNFGYPIAMVGDPEIAARSPGWLDVLIHDSSGDLFDCPSYDLATFDGVTSGNAPCSLVPGPSGGVALGVGAAGMGDGRLLIVGINASYGTPSEQFFTPAGNSGWLGGTGGIFVSPLDVASW